jgi:hypothetical protein
MLSPELRRHQSLVIHRDKYPTLTIQNIGCNRRSNLDEVVCGRKGDCNGLLRCSWRWWNIEVKVAIQLQHWVSSDSKVRDQGFRSIYED